MFLSIKYIEEFYENHKNDHIINEVVAKKCFETIKKLKKNNQITKQLIKKKKIPLIFGIMRLGIGLSKSYIADYFNNKIKYDNIEFIMNEMETNYLIYPIYMGADLTYAKNEIASTCTEPKIDYFIMSFILQDMSKYYNNKQWIMNITGFNLLAKKIISEKPTLYDFISKCLIEKGVTWSFAEDFLGIRFLKETHIPIDEIVFFSEKYKKSLLKIIETLSIEKEYDEFKFIYDINDSLPDIYASRKKDYDTYIGLPRRIKCHLG